MSGFLIFEIKRDKMDKILNFLKDRFSVMNGPMDMIFGMFSETDVRQNFSKYSKSYHMLNIKRCLKFNGFWKKRRPC